MNINFTKPIDSALLSYGVLKRLRSGRVDTFEHRLKSQKYHYFAQIFGVVSYYSYNLYIRGPYSPDLANDLYTIKRKNIGEKVDIERFLPDELESRFVELKNFLRGKNLRRLEITATLHWLLNVAKLPAKKAQDKLIELKKISDREINIAINAQKFL